MPLHPSYFTPHLKEYLQNLLHHQVEGSCSGRLGYIVAVLEVLDIGRGKVVEGGAEFKIKYRACVYRPFRGEVVDGVVASVNKVNSARFLATAALLIPLNFYRWAYLRMSVRCNVSSQRM